MPSFPVTVDKDVDAEGSTTGAFSVAMGCWTSEESLHVNISFDLYFGVVMSLTPVYLPSANDLGVKSMLVEFENWLLPGLHW